GGHHDPVVCGLAGQVDGDRGILETADFVVLDVDLTPVKALEARSVVIAEEPPAIGEQTVELAPAVQRCQFVAQPDPILLFRQQVRTLGYLVQQVTKEVLRIGAADRAKAAKRQLPEIALEGSVMSKAEILACELPAKRMGVRVRGNSSRHVAHVCQIE